MIPAHMTIDGRPTRQNRKARLDLVLGKITKPFDPCMEPMRAYRPPFWRLPILDGSYVYAASVPCPFTVETEAKRVEGKAGDYLVLGVLGDMYPVDAAAFVETYKEAEL